MNRSITVNPRQRMRKGRLIDKLTKLFIDKKDNMNIIKFRNSDFHIERNEFENNSKRFKNINNNKFDYKERLHNFQSWVA